MAVWGYYGGLSQGLKQVNRNCPKGKVSPGRTMVPAQQVVAKSWALGECSLLQGGIRRQQVWRARTAAASLRSLVL